MAKNMNKLLKQAQKMQAQMMKAQEDLQKQEVEGTAGGGMVTMKINGSNELVGVSINPEAVDPDDVEMLEDLVLAAVIEAMEKGVLSGHPLVDMKVSLVDGSYHEVDSSEMAFQIAGTMAFREACGAANPVLLEPIMRVEIAVPEVLPESLLDEAEILVATEFTVPPRVGDQRSVGRPTRRAASAHIGEALQTGAVGICRPDLSLSGAVRVERRPDPVGRERPVGIESGG